jgi:hypothetical protein
MDGMQNYTMDEIISLEEDLTSHLVDVTEKLSVLMMARKKMEGKEEQQGLYAIGSYGEDSREVRC